MNKLIILVSILSFWVENPARLARVNDYYKENPFIRETLEKYNSLNDALLGMCIIAPEIAINSGFIDFMEIQIMEMIYIEFNRANFSIGPFQMKPSFAIFLENYVEKNKLTQYEQLKIIGNDEKKIRKQRIRRLSSLEWQTLYLSAFLDYVKKYTSDIKFSNETQKLKYWATLYNSGLELSQSEVISQQKKKQFPHFSSKFNYSEVALEFYEKLKEINF